jgi:hypothetical protein
MGDSICFQKVAVSTYDSKPTITTLKIQKFEHYLQNLNKTSWLHERKSEFNSDQLFISKPDAKKFHKVIAELTRTVTYRYCFAGLREDIQET